MLIEYKLPDTHYMMLLRQGVVQQGMFQLRDLERNKDWEEYPDFTEINNPNYDPKYDVRTNTHYDNDEFMSRGSYGVCDNLENLLKVYPELEDTGEGCRKFVVTMCQIDRNEEPDSGGWRWHKWGGLHWNSNPNV